MTSGEQNSRTIDVVRADPRSQLLLICGVLLFLALGVRLLVWQFNRAAIAPVMSGLTLTYKDDARILARGDLRLFLRGPDPPSNANVLAHPPGYPIVLASIFSVFGESDFAIRFFQTFGDAISIVFVFLIALELTTKRVAVVAGTLAALSPQFAYNSLLLLPDSLSVLPILIGVYLLVRARNESPSWLKMAAAGATFGLSCWLRPNALLLPLFASVLMIFVFKSGHRLRNILPLIGSAILLIAPMTIRNLVVFKSFVPISLGSGVTFIEGIADYHNDVKMGLPKTDVQVLQDEVHLYNRSDYGGSLYNPDGIARERARVARGIGTISSRPFWFAGVMIRRAASMLRLERVPVISGSPLVLESHAVPFGEPSLLTKLLRIPAMILKAVQKLFVTAVMLPLALIGLFFLVKKRRTLALAFIIIVPVYFICVQSLLHTEYRYVLAIHYFILALVATAVSTMATSAWKVAYDRKAKPTL